MLNIKNSESDRLARELAQKTEETITNAVITALKEQLLQVQEKTIAGDLGQDLFLIGQRCAGLPDRDTRSVQDILRYNNHGLPH